MHMSTTLRYLRMAPRKVRMVTGVLRGKKAVEAAALLRYTPRGAAKPLEKMLQSAVATAKNNFQLEEENLYIAKIVVFEGPKLKRYRPRARGRAFPIQKKTSHITLVLDEITPSDGSGAQTEKSAKIQTEGDVKEKKTVREDKPKFRAAQDMAKPKAEGVGKRLFRRKAV